MGSKHTYRSLSTARWPPPAPLVSATERHRNDTSSVEMSTATLTEPVRLADCDGPFTAGRLEDCRQPATSPTGARRVAVVVFVSVSSRRMGVGWECGTMGGRHANEQTGRRRQPAFWLRPQLPFLLRRCSCSRGIRGRNEAQPNPPDPNPIQGWRPGSDYAGSSILIKLSTFVISV